MPKLCESCGRATKNHNEAQCVLYSRFRQKYLQRKAANGPTVNTSSSETTSQLTSSANRSRRVSFMAPRGAADGETSTSQFHEITSKHTGFVGSRKTLNCLLCSMAGISRLSGKNPKETSETISDKYGIANSLEFSKSQLTLVEDHVRALGIPFSSQSRQSMDRFAENMRSCQYAVVKVEGSSVTHWLNAANTGEGVRYIDYQEESPTFRTFPTKGGEKLHASSATAVFCLPRPKEIVIKIGKETPRTGGSNCCVVQ